MCGDLVEVGRKHWVIGLSSAEIENEVAGGSAAEFHQQHSFTNGLIEECRASELTLAVFQAELMQFLQTFRHEKQCPFAGYSVHCDRDVLKIAAPEVYHFMSHQVIDVTTIRGLMSRWLPMKVEEFKEAKLAECNHRAMNDVDSSLEALRWMRSNVFQSDDAAAAVSAKKRSDTDSTRRVEQTRLYRHVHRQESDDIFVKCVIDSMDN